MECGLCERIQCSYCQWKTLYHDQQDNIMCATCGYSNGFMEADRVHFVLLHPVANMSLTDMSDYLPITVSDNGIPRTPDWHRKVKRH